MKIQMEIEVEVSFGVPGRQASTRGCRAQTRERKPKCFSWDSSLHGLHLILSEQLMFSPCFCFPAWARRNRGPIVVSSCPESESRVQNAELGCCCAQRDPRMTMTATGFVSLPAISLYTGTGGLCSCSVCSGHLSGVVWVPPFGRAIQRSEKVIQPEKTIKDLHEIECA